MVAQWFFGFVHLQFGQTGEHNVGIYQGGVVRMIDLLYHITFGKDGPTVKFGVQIVERRMRVEHVGLRFLRHDVAATELSAQRRIDSVVPFLGVLHVAVGSPVVYVVGGILVQIAALNHGSEQQYA